MWQIILCWSWSLCVCSVSDGHTPVAARSNETHFDCIADWETERNDNDDDGGKREGRQTNLMRWHTEMLLAKCLYVNSSLLFFTSEQILTATKVNWNSGALACETIVCVQRHFFLSNRCKKSRTIFVLKIPICTDTWRRNIRSKARWYFNIYRAHNFGVRATMLFNQRYGAKSSFAPVEPIQHMHCITMTLWKMSQDIQLKSQHFSAFTE